MCAMVTLQARNLLLVVSENSASSPNESGIVNVTAIALPFLAQQSSEGVVAAPAHYSSADESAMILCKAWPSTCVAMLPRAKGFVWRKATVVTIRRLTFS
jgi:hypothetical protein